MKPILSLKTDGTWLLAIVACLLAPNLCFSHDEKLHEALTKSAFLSSGGVNTFLSENFGANDFTMLPFLTANPPPFENTAAGGFTPCGWMTEGSYWEDTLDQPYEFLRSSDHFYTLMPNRQPGQVLGLTDSSESKFLWFGILPSPIINSFAWATTRGAVAPALPKLRLTTIPNAETWPNARDYQFAALTNATKVARDQNMAHMLYALGHVLHLNQDTSQPDHVRNDEHKIKNHRYIEKYGHDVYLTKAQQSQGNFDQLFPQMSHGWSYWQSKGFAKLLDFWDRGLYINGSSDALNQEKNGSIKLGLAEFSNGNFLGEDALYKEYFDPSDIHYFPFPSLNTGTTFPSVRSSVASGKTTSFLKDGRAIYRIGISKTGDGISVAHHSVLNYLGATFPRHGGAAVSVSSTINDPNVLQDYHSILIPKAVEYSAGILDYFFRGTMTVSTIGYDTNLLQYTNLIINTSGQDFHGGTFCMFEDDASGVRSLIAQTNLIGTLANSNSLAMVFPASASFTNKFLVVYQGTIGFSNSAALDPVDDGISIAVATGIISDQIIFDLSWDDTNAEVDLYLTDPLGVTLYEPDLYPNLTSTCCTVVGGDDAGDEVEGTTQHMVVSNIRKDGNYQLWANLEYLNDSGPVNVTLTTSSLFSGQLSTETFTLTTAGSGQRGRAARMLPRLAGIVPMEAKLG